MIQWLKDKLNWILGSISLLLAVFVFLKKDNKPSEKYLEEEKKILTNKAQIDIIESDIKKAENTLDLNKSSHEEEVKKVLDDKDPKNLLDFFNNRLNK